MPACIRVSIAVVLFCLCSLVAMAQPFVDIKGTVYDASQRNPVVAVSVLSVSGRGTITDAFGHYAITLPITDSIYFSYQNKATIKYAVSSIAQQDQFNMALQINVPNALPPVTVFGKNYRFDSLQNRMEYAKYFNYQKPNPLRNVNIGNGGVGMDPNDIINLFRFRRNRQLQTLQTRLVADEQRKYVDYRFNRTFVKKVTGLSDQPLKIFMYKYRPPYDFLAIINDLELGFYIQQCYKKEMGMLPPGVDIYLLGIDPVEKELPQMIKPEQ